MLYLSDAAMRHRGILNLNYPIHRGFITNWDDMEQLWRHTFYNELRVVPEEYPVLLCEPLLNPRGARERTTQTMFETLNIPALYLADQAMLALYASGRSTGVVLDSGDGVTHAVSIYEGHALQHSVSRLELGGRDLTERIAQTLAPQAPDVVPAALFDVARNVKEKVCYVALNFDREIVDPSVTGPKAATYSLPDGRDLTLNLGEERVSIPEALFKPSSLGLDNGMGFHELVYNTIQKTDRDLHRDLYGNIVLAGGSTMFPFIRNRLANDVADLAPSSVKVMVLIPPERKWSSWIGGSIMASLETFQNRWCSKQEYDEIGPQIVYRKFL